MARRILTTCDAKLLGKVTMQLLAEARDQNWSIMIRHDSVRRHEQEKAVLRDANSFHLRSAVMKNSISQGHPMSARTASIPVKHSSSSNGLSRKLPHIIAAQSQSVECHDGAFHHHSSHLTQVHVLPNGQSHLYNQDS